MSTRPTYRQLKSISSLRQQSGISLPTYFSKRFTFSIGLLIALPGIIFSILGSIFTQRKNMAIIGLVLSFVSLLLVIGNTLDYLGTLH